MAVKENAVSVLVLVADGSEEMEAVITVDTLRRAQVTVAAVGTSDLAVTCSRQVVLQADTTLSEIVASRTFVDYNMLVLPGGLGGTKTMAKSEDVIAMLQYFAKEESKYVAAICAAPTVLRQANVFMGKNLTSYPVFEKDLSQDYKYQKDRVVVDGRLITSQGPGTSFEFALRIVQILKGREVAQSTADGMLLHRSIPVLD